MRKLSGSSVFSQYRSPGSSSPYTTRSATRTLFTETGLVTGEDILIEWKCYIKANRRASRAYDRRMHLIENIVSE